MSLLFPCPLVVCQSQPGAGFEILVVRDWTERMTKPVKPCANQDSLENSIPLSLREWLCNLSDGRRYGFIKEPLRDRNESRLALIPSSPFSRIPKLPRSSPLASSSRSSSLPQEQSAMAMAASGPKGGEPPSPPLPSSSKLGSGGRGGEADGDGGKGKGRREKEMERTEKWMRMMGVKRKVGGNAVEWVWKGEGSTKVC